MGGPVVSHVEKTSRVMLTRDSLYLSKTSRFSHPEIHSWYTSVMAFPDHLVQSILESFSPNKNDVFLDPHCGSGTSIVEAQRYGLRCFGLDANPVSVLASKVKTDWSPDLSSGRKFVDRLERDQELLSSDSKDPIFVYLNHSGMISRGWITEGIASTAIALRRWIDRVIRHGPLYRFFMLAFVSTVVADLANVRFGPEIYCVPERPDPPDVFKCYTCRVNRMLDDVEGWQAPDHSAHIRLGDSRDGRSMRSAAKWEDGPVYVITSPPYPTEHDYTRNSRLELVFMGSVGGLESLRAIKRKMIRSHSKGIYVGDHDGMRVRSFGPVKEIVAEIDSRVREGASGFEGQYTKVIANYFGGMLRHLAALDRYLRPGSRLAYVVGDEASYKGVHIPTSQVLTRLVENYLSRLRVDDVVLWRSRNPVRKRRSLDENVIIMRVD